MTTEIEDGDQAIRLAVLAASEVAVLPWPNSDAPITDWLTNTAEARTRAVLRYAHAFARARGHLPYALLLGGRRYQIARRAA